MFNIGPLELTVLAIIGIVVLGPERLPGLARDAARMLKTLRELATGARQQLRDELGPEFADVDLRNLNPRTALTRAVFGDEEELDSLRKLDPRRWDAKSAARDFVTVPDDDRDNHDSGDDRVSFDKGGRTDPASGGTLNGNSSNGHAANGFSANGHAANGSSSNGASSNGHAAGAQPSRPRPRPRPGPRTPYDQDAT